MQITMVPGACSNEYQPTSGSFCESCFARWLIYSRGTDLPCITAVAEDGAEEQTLLMRYGAHEQTTLLTDAERERLAYGGWKGWVEWVEQL
jgi:hypothetical protein